MTLMLIQIPWESHVVFTEFFNREQARTYWRFHFKFALLAVFLCFLTSGGVFLIPLTGIPGLLVKAVVATAVSGGFLLAFFRQDVLAVIKALRKGKN